MIHWYWIIFHRYNRLLHK